MVGSSFPDRTPSASAREHAKHLRRRLTPPETTLWKQLRAKRFQGLRFRRQHPIGPYVVDFYCPDLRVVIELDGDSHADQAAYDDERTAWLEGAGCTVLRFSNRQALNEVEGVRKVIAEVCGVDLSVGGKGEEPYLHLSPAAGERAWDAAVC